MLLIYTVMCVNTIYYR